MAPSNDDDLSLSPAVDASTATSAVAAVTSPALAAETAAEEEPASSSNSYNYYSSPCGPSNIVPSADEYEWSSFRDDEVMNQQSAIQAEEAAKIPFVGDKEPISALAAEFQSGNPILQEKIKLIGEKYVAIRRTRGDGNCFFRSFMFSYLEHILESQDKAEVDRLMTNIEQCKETLKSLGYSEFTFEDFFLMFDDQLKSVLQGKNTPISHEELLERTRDQSISDYVVMFFRFITSGEIHRRSQFFEPFIMGLSGNTVDKFCKSVERMGEESDHVHITALSDAVGVAIRVVYLDRSSCEAGPLTVNHHDFIPSAAPSKSSPEQDDGTSVGTNTTAGSGAPSNPQNQDNDTTESAATPTENTLPKPFVTLLYRPGHYDILYPK